MSNATISLASVIAVVAVIACGILAPASSAGSHTVVRATHSARVVHKRVTVTYAHQVLTLTNRQRRAHGCRPLHWQPKLARSAQAHTNRMSGAGLLSHVLGHELGLVTRIVRTGYRPWRRLAENVAVGYPNPGTVVRAWMHSPEHRRNILTCSLRDLGVGVTVDRAGTYWWTQDFGAR